MSNYPDGIDSFTTWQNDVHDVDASVVNDIQDAVVAIQESLGVDPQDAFTSVGHRLEAEELSWLPRAKLLTGRRHLYTQDGVRAIDRHYLSIDAGLLVSGLPDQSAGDVVSFDLSALGTTGALAAQLKDIGFSYDVASDRVIFHCENGFKLTYVAGDDAFEWKVWDGSDWLTGVKSAAQSFSSGDDLLVVCSWNPTTTKISLNGSTYNEAAESNGVTGGTLCIGGNGNGGAGLRVHQCVCLDVEVSQSDVDALWNGGAPASPATVLSAQSAHVLLYAPFDAPSTQGAGDSTALASAGDFSATGATLTFTPAGASDYLNESGEYLLTGGHWLELPKFLFNGGEKSCCMRVSPLRGTSSGTLLHTGGAHPLIIGYDAGALTVTAGSASLSHSVSADFDLCVALSSSMAYLFVDGVERGSASIGATPLTSEGIHLGNVSAGNSPAECRVSDFLVYDTTFDEVQAVAWHEMGTAAFVPHTLREVIAIDYLAQGDVVVWEGMREVGLSGVANSPLVAGVAHIGASSGESTFIAVGGDHPVNGTFSAGDRLVSAASGAASAAGSSPEVGEFAVALDSAVAILG